MLDAVIRPAHAECLVFCVRAWYVPCGCLRPWRYHKEGCHYGHHTLQHLVCSVITACARMVHPNHPRLCMLIYMHIKSAPHLLAMPAWKALHHVCMTHLSSVPPQTLKCALAASAHPRWQ